LRERLALGRERGGALQSGGDIDLFGRTSGERRMIDRYLPGDAAGSLRERLENLELPMPKLDGPIVQPAVYREHLGADASGDQVGQ